MLRMSSIRLLIALLAVTPLIADGFRAGVAKVDITPQTSQWLMGYGPRKSTGVHDPIYHRAVVMDDGRSRFYLVASDLCLFSPELYDEVAADLKRKFGIERKQFWWSVTHTHSAPEVGPHGVYDVLLKGRSDHEWDREYAQHIKSTLIAAVEQAMPKARACTSTDRNRHVQREHQPPRKRCRRQDQSRSESRRPGRPADRTDSYRTAEWIAYRADCELCDSRHGAQRQERSDQRRCAGHRFRLCRTETRSPGSFHERRCRKCRSDLFCLP